MEDIYNERTEKILGFVKDKQYRPMTPKDMSVLLEIKAQDMQMFYDILDDLEKQGKIVMTRKNKIVMVITHEPDDAVEIVDGESRCMFTKVLVLARSSKDKAGHLAYFGNPSEALGYFNVKKLQDIMLEINPITEGGRGRADIYIEKYTDMERK